MLDFEYGRVSMTVVVSPLLALIRSQMRSLSQAGIQLSTRTVSGADDARHKRETLAMLAAAASKLQRGDALTSTDVPRVLYVTPEAIVGKDSEHIQNNLRVLGKHVSLCSASFCSSPGDRRCGDD
jgi:superfamily II DNA helicase RecQ